jgi:hypothetical protein
MMLEVVWFYYALSGPGYYGAEAAFYSGYECRHHVEDRHGGWCVERPVCTAAGTPGQGCPTPDCPSGHYESVGGGSFVCR